MSDTLTPELGAVCAASGAKRADARSWSFYIFSSGSRLNEGLIGDFETERSEQTGELLHFLA